MASPRATAYLFPGQGAQSAAALPAVRRDAPDLLACCVEELGDEPFTRCDESTRFAQPAILLASLAAWRRIAPGGERAFAGHSLGELSALAAAGALSQLDAVRLAVIRGEEMARAGETGESGSMLALLKGTPQDAAELAREHGLSVANDNAPGQLVVSGPRAGIDAARRGAREHGLRALELNVAGAFHSPAMEPARAAYERALGAIDWRAPRHPVYSGLTAAPFTDPVRELSQAVVAPVRWREVMAALAAAGCERYVDVGPGDVLEKLVARNLPQEGERAAA
ncbi:MAG TPA: ACP S-malonyltransferase [Solirubrobacteraceae bacterium]